MIEPTALEIATDMVDTHTTTDNPLAKAIVAGLLAEELRKLGIK